MSPGAPIAIVDAHHHLWRLRGRSPVRYPWLEEEYDPAPFLLGDYQALCNDFAPVHYRAACASLPVVATVHVEAECDRRDALAETRWLHDVAAADGMPRAVVAWVDLLADDAAQRLAEQAAWPLVRAVRFKPRTAAGPTISVAGEPASLQDPRWPAALQRLQQQGLGWELRVPFWHLEEAAAVVGEHPGLPVMLQHAGLPWDRSAAGLAAWRRGMAALAACDNVHVKLSEFGLRDAPWRAEDNAVIVHDTLALFGWQRCVFGSNFPVASLRVGYAPLVSAVQAMLAGLTPAQQHAVWCGNALRWYRMGPLETA